MVMKNLFILLCVTISFTCLAQPTVNLAMSKSYTLSTGDTTLMGTPITLKVWVKNKSTAIFTGSLSIIAQLDTLNGIECDTAFFLSKTILNNDSALVLLNFIPTPTTGTNTVGFKVAGNGNTIVVWPMANVQISDSLRTYLYLSGTVGLNELQKSILAIYPNPTSSNITILQAPNNVPKQIEIYDMFGRKVKDLDFAKTIDVSELARGCYMLQIIADDKTYRTLFVKE
jgi:Secretion system C-terminal sorting domain